MVRVGAVTWCVNDADAVFTLVGTGSEVAHCLAAPGRTPREGRRDPCRGDAVLAVLRRAAARLSRRRTASQRPVGVARGRRDDWVVQVRGSGDRHRFVRHVGAGTVRLRLFRHHLGGARRARGRTFWERHNDDADARCTTTTARARGSTTSAATGSTTGRCSDSSKRACAASRRTRRFSPRRSRRPSAYDATSRAPTSMTPRRCSRHWR